MYVTGGLLVLCISDRAHILDRMWRHFSPSVAGQARSIIPLQSATPRIGLLLSRLSWAWYRSTTLME